MRDYFKTDEFEFLPSIDYLRMSWIILVDNSGSMGPHALDPNSLALDVKNAIGTMLEEINKISEEQEILSYIRIIAFNDLVSYSVGNRSHGEYITEAVNMWRNFELVPYGGTNIASAIYEAVESIRTDRFEFEYLSSDFLLSPVLMLITDGMANLADRVGNSMNNLKNIRKGKTIRASIGLRHEYSKDLDSFASRGNIEHIDGRIDLDKPFSFFVESADDLSNVCKVLSRGLISIALNDDNYILFDPTEVLDEEDDDWWWE